MRFGKKQGMPEKSQLMVAAWSPSAEQGLPASEVHLVIQAVMDGKPIAAMAQFSSRQAVNELIQALEKNRDYVWGQIPPITDPEPGEILRG